MRFINKIIFLVSITITTVSCRQAGKEVGEIFEKKVGSKLEKKIVEKVVKTTMLTRASEEIVESYVKEISEIGLSKEAKEYALANFDNQIIEKFLKIVKTEKKFLANINSNPAFLKSWKTFSNTGFSSNINQFNRIQQDFGNDKYILKVVGDGVEIVESRSGNLLGKFENDKIVAFAGKGGKELNPILNIHPLIPNTQYKLKNLTFDSDKFGRVEKMNCPLLSKELKVERNKIEQGLSKRIKDGRLRKDEKGDLITGKDSNYYYSTDDGGHLLANLFGGPSEQINYLPMSNEANKVTLKKLETFLSKQLNEGKKVSDFTVSPKFKGRSRRPERLYISYYVNGKYFSQVIKDL